MTDLRFNLNHLIQLLDEVGATTGDPSLFEIPLIQALIEPWYHSRNLNTLQSLILALNSLLLELTKVYEENQKNSRRQSSSLESTGSPFKIDLLSDRRSEYQFNNKLVGQATNPIFKFGLQRSCLLRSGLAFHCWPK